VHVHDVGAAIQAGIEAGRPHRIAVTHFGDQQRARTAVSPRGPVAVVACAAGEGLAQVFSAAGAVPHEHFLKSQLDWQEAAVKAGVAQLEKVLEIEVFLDELPVAARETLQKETGEGKCGEITKTDEEGETLYETEITRDGKTRSVSVNAKGQVVYREEPIALADAPDAVQKVFHAQLDAGAAPSKITKITSDGEVSYLGEWTAQGACRTLTVAADGKVPSSEPESPAETTAKP